MHGFAEFRTCRRGGRAVLLGLVMSTVLSCHRGSTPTVPEGEPRPTPHPVRIVVVDDPPFADILDREWKARMTGELQLQQLTLAQLESVVQLAADLIIYPSACLGTVAERKLIGTPSPGAYENEQYAQRDVFELQRNAEVGWGRQAMAFSFGSPQLVLMYRADLLHKRQLKPPTTWEEYQRLAEQMTRSELGELAPPAGQPWHAVCEPLGDGWASKVLLARAASYASHPSQFSVLFDYTTMQPLIAGPPFVRALEELVAASKLGSTAADQLTPESARRAIMAGQAAMALSWPSHATTDGKPLELADGIELGFARLPGATTAYNVGEQIWTTHEANQSIPVPLLAIAGRLGSVVQNARRPREAADLLALLSSKEWSERLSPASTATTLFRHSQAKKPTGWTDAALTLEASERYAEVVSQTQSQPAHLCSLRIPGWQRYLAVLDTAVLAARSGEQTPADALTQAAQAWSTITQELGSEQQRAAYTRSLGLDP